MDRRNETISAKYLRLWGVSSFVRYCRNIGLDFEDAYWLVFGKYPTR